jgi:hypothetical protein
MAPTYRKNPRAPYYDKPLSDFSNLYQNDALKFVADILAPYYEVDREVGKFFVYSKEATYRLYDDKREGVTESNEVDWSLTDASYSCIERALHSKIDPKDVEQEEDAVDLENDATQFVTNGISLNREYRVVTNLTDTAVMPNTAATYVFSNSSATPKADIEAAAQAVETATGHIATDIFLPYDVALAISRHDDFKKDKWHVVDLTQIDIGNPVGPILWGLKVHIVTARYSSTARIGTSDPTLTKMWGTNSLVCYLNPSPVGRKSLHLAKTFVLRGWRPMIYRLPLEHIKPGAYKIEMATDVDERVTASGCGYVLTGCI